MVEDSELEKLKRRRLEAMQKRLMTSKRKKEMGPENPREVLSRVLIGRGLEVLGVAEQQYSKIIPKVVEALAKQISRGQLNGPINGEQLLWFFRRLGLDVRLKTRIRILEHGELKTIEEKLKTKLR